MKWFLGVRLVICGRIQERLQAVHAELRSADHVMQECNFAQPEGIAPWLKAVGKQDISNLARHAAFEVRGARNRSGAGEMEGV